MKEIVLYEDEDWKTVSKIYDDGIVWITRYSKIGGKSLIIDDIELRFEDIKKIYQAIEEEG